MSWIQTNEFRAKHLGALGIADRLHAAGHFLQREAGEEWLRRAVARRHMRKLYEPAFLSAGAAVHQERPADRVSRPGVDPLRPTVAAAAKVLGKSRHLEATEELRGLIADEDARVVAVAIRSVGRLFRDGELATDGIYDLMENALGSEPLVALAACEALVEMGGDRAGALARSALQCAEPDVVRAAVVCLGLHGDETDLAEAISLVSHPDWSVRAEIAQVLSERGYRKCLPALLRRLEVEDDPFVRQVMLRAIGRLEQ